MQILQLNSFNDPLLPKVGVPVNLDLLLSRNEKVYYIYHVEL